VHPSFRISPRLRKGGLLLALTGVFMACATAAGHGGSLGPMDGGGGDDGSQSSSTGGSSGSFGSSSGSMFTGYDAGQPDADAGQDDAHMTVCRGDAGDAGCTCINIASIGHEGVWGPCSGDSTTAFQAWLNAQSTAHVDTFDQTKPTITADFLSHYDVIILQWMVDPANASQSMTGCPAPCLKQNEGAPWSFSAAEISALQTWVQNGGGVIALDGFQGNDPSMVVDITSTNQLLGFTDMAFNKDVLLGNGNTGDDHCWGNADVLGGPITTNTNSQLAATMVTGPGTWSQAPGSIGLHVSDIGVLDTRSINVKDSTKVVIDAQWTDSTGTHVGAAHEDIGKGHVFLYGDEWLTYTGEWSGIASCQAGIQFDSSYDPCYNSSAAQVFQIPQFWYNSIKYAASAVQCFTIMIPPEAGIGQIVY
jgi:hypothetical protein